MAINWDEVREKARARGKANEQYIQSIQRAAAPSSPKVTPSLPKAQPKPLPTFQSVLDEYNTSLPGIGRQVAKALPEARKQEISQGTQRFFEQAPVQAGFMQGVSLNNPVKSLEKKLGTQIDTSKAQASIPYKVGEIGGIMAQFAIPYAGASKGIGTLTAKALPKLGKVGQGVARSVATDLAVGLPLNVNYAFNKEGLRGKEAVKSIGVNTAIDLIAGGILEAVPLILKSGKKVASKADFDALSVPEKQEVVLRLTGPTEPQKLLPEGINWGEPIRPDFYVNRGGVASPDVSAVQIAGELPAPARINPSFNPTRRKLSDPYTDFNKEYQRTVESVADYIRNYKGKGVQVGVVPKNSDELMRDGAIRYAQSDNDLWYRDFFKAHGRAPLKSEAEDIAKELVDDSLRRGSGEFLNEDLYDLLKYAEYKDTPLPRINKEVPKVIQPPQLPRATREAPFTVTRGEMSSTMEAPRKYPASTMEVKPGIPPQASISPAQPSLPRKGTEIPKEQPFAQSVDLPKGKVEQKFKDLGADTNRFEEVAQVMTDSRQARPSVKELASDLVSNVKRKFVDAGDTVAKIAKINNDQGLYYLYNNARNARKRAEFHIGEAQTDIMGNKIGKSLKEIFDPIRKKGDAYYEDFQEYMYHLHNIDRMAQGKPVFGESITADESKKVSEYLLGKHPEFAREAADVRKYLDNMMQYRVQGGLVSEDSAKALAEMYQNYVPTYRLNPSTKGARYSGQITDIRTGIKKATGSSKDLLPLHEQISKQTMQAVDAAHKNLFGQRLAENINPNTRQYIQELKKIDDAFDIDTVDLPELKNTFNVYKDGQGFQMKVDDTLYEGIKALAATEPSELARAAMAANKGFKQLITSYNPMFLIRNAARDIQDTGLYSKDLSKFAKMYPGAVKEISTNGAMWQKYKALGGAGNSFFDYAKGYKKDPSWLKKNTLDRIESLNMAIEQLPRFTEFLATLEKLGRPPTYDDLMQAMYNAADVTVNFGRSGTWGKTLNSTFVPFFNPAIQGSSKLIRRFTEAKGVKGWTELVLKATALGVAPSLINEMVYSDDPQYQMINDREKDINFIIKIGDGEFIKFPKGRVLSLFGSGAQRLYRASQGQEDSFAGYIKTMADQVAPISPFESNIASPIAAVKNNKSWYGGKIEPQRLEKYSPGKRFDESTTSFSKAIGGALNVSPKKIDYLFDAYSGVIGDFAIPLSTPKAERNPFVKAFTIDSVSQNKLSQQFYDKVDEIKFAKNDVEGSDKYDVMSRYINKQSDAISEMYNEIRKVENGLGTDKYKREKVREIKGLINGMQQSALDGLSEVEKAAEQLSKRYKDPDVLYREVNKKVFGAEYALKTYNKDVYEKAVKSQVGFDKFYDSYFTQIEYPSDLGKAIALEKKNLNTYKAFGISDKNANMARAINAYGLSDAYNQTYPKLKGITGSEEKMNVINQSNPGLTREQLVLLYEAFDISQGTGRYKRQFD